MMASTEEHTYCHILDAVKYKRYHNVCDTTEQNQ